MKEISLPQINVDLCKHCLYMSVQYIKNIVLLLHKNKYT